MSQREQRAEQLEALSKMFMSKGWQIIQKDMEGALQHLLHTKWAECKTGDEFLKAKGEIEAIGRMVNFKAMIANEIENFDKLSFADEAPPEGERNSLED